MRQLRAMAAAGEKPTEIAKALGVGRATVYRHLEPPVPPAVSVSGEEAVAPGKAPRAGAESVVVSDTTAAAPSSAAAAEPGAVKSAAKRRSTSGAGGWFVVEADGADPDAPVVVRTRHRSERAARAARSRVRFTPGPDGTVLAVRSAEQITSRLEWDPELRRGVVRIGPPSC